MSFGEIRPESVFSLSFFVDSLSPSIINDACPTWHWCLHFSHFSMSLNSQRFNPSKGPSWSLSYSSWNYNYMFSQCLSPLKLWVRTPFMAMCTRYNIMW